VGQGLAIRGDGVGNMECYAADPPSTRAMPRYAAAGTYNGGAASSSASGAGYGAAGTKDASDPGAPVGTGNSNLDSIIAVSKLAEAIGNMGPAAAAGGAVDLSLPLPRPSTTNSAVKSAPVTATKGAGFGTSNLRLVASTAAAPPPAKRPPPVRPPPPSPTPPAAPRLPPPLRKAPPPGRAPPLGAQAKATMSLSSLLNGGSPAQNGAGASQAIDKLPASAAGTSSLRRKLPPPSPRKPPPGRK
jgi:hypothetical protein